MSIRAFLLISMVLAIGLFIGGMIDDGPTGDRLSQLGMLLNLINMPLLALVISNRQKHRD